MNDCIFAWEYYFCLPSVQEQDYPVSPSCIHDIIHSKLINVFNDLISVWAGSSYLMYKSFNILFCSFPIQHKILQSYEWRTRNICKCVTILAYRFFFPDYKISGLDSHFTYKENAPVFPSKHDQYWNWKIMH